MTMLQKIFAIIGCVLICLFLSIGLGVGATILVETMKERSVERAEEFPEGDEFINPDELPGDDAAADTP